MVFWRVLLLVLAFACCAQAAAARPKRHFFEPDDLELEHPGVLDLDLQTGPVLGSSASNNRFVLPDFEIDLGLGPNVELGLDGTFSVEHVDEKQRHYAGDPLWLAPKIGILDLRDDDGSSWALGVEFGPRLPVLDLRGIGYGALLLAGYSKGGTHLVLNAGALIDPSFEIREHTTSTVVGLDFDCDFNVYWSMQGELGVAYYLTGEPTEITLTSGVTYAANENLDLSVTPLVGLMPNTDRAGLMLGISPKTKLW